MPGICHHPLRCKRTGFGLQSLTAARKTGGRGTAASAPPDTWAANPEEEQMECLPAMRAALGQDVLLRVAR